MGKRDKRLDWLTTGLLILVPIILSLQDTIMGSIPPQYGVIAALVFGALSQIFTEGRVQSVKDKYKQIEAWTVNDISVLYDLLQKNIITKEEFEEKKNQLLGL